MVDNSGSCITILAIDFRLSSDSRLDQLFLSRNRTKVIEHVTLNCVAPIIASVFYKTHKFYFPKQVLYVLVRNIKSVPALSGEYEAC